MNNNKVKDFIKKVVKNQPKDWLHLTTHRLDIYDEETAKSEFLDQFEILFNTDNYQISALESLPTAYDYIRLGHPLSCILEWAVARQYNIDAENIISFGSQSMPVLAILRSNKLQNKNTQILFTKELPDFFNSEIFKNIYGYNFELKKINSVDKISFFEGSTILISSKEENVLLNSKKNILDTNVDFYITMYDASGSILIINDHVHKNYIADIQHVRRRETVAMTPADSLQLLNNLIGTTADIAGVKNPIQKEAVSKLVNKITGTKSKVLVATSGLSIQYAIMMGLVHEAQQNHPGKAIKLVVPPNCYGGTNDQARRVAEVIENVEIVDLHVDGDNEMVQSLDVILQNIAQQNAVPYIIAEIPTNPRVEVPDLENLRSVLSKPRTTADGKTAVDPIFILDQTFCPNYQFLGEGEVLSTVRSFSYASGSKFPSGGKCTAGYVVGNTKVDALMEKIALHLRICDNEATDLQYNILAAQLPSMLQRIDDAYKNTREFVTYIQEVLPEAKINFVTDELAAQGFTPSVFSLDLPSRGNSKEEKEQHKRDLNLKLINIMITEIPNESKFCVSYGQLKGCYWTVPATSTQGTTKEGDKDYIVRASLSPDLNLDLHKKVFSDFVKSM